jgi:hypothetical protein
LPRGIQVLTLAKGPRQRYLLLGSQHRHPIDGRDVRIEVAEAAWMQRQRTRVEGNQ